MTPSWLAWTLAQRFRRSREKTAYLSFISASSTIGIGLGCAVLIVLLSVMNGFQKALETEFLSLVPHVEFTSVSGNLADWETVVQQAEQHAQVVAAAPVTTFNGMVQRPGRFHGVELRAVNPELEPRVSGLTRYVDATTWDHFQNSAGSLLLGQGLADELELAVGDRVRLLVPTPGATDLAAAQRLTVTLAGTFQMHGELDFQQGYVHLEHTNQALNQPAGARSVRLRVSDVYQAPGIGREVSSTLQEYAYVHDWTRTQGHLYRDIQLVRTVMYLVLVLVLVVASFNIVSTLIMAVQEKRSSIAILKTMGATDNLILRTFVWQGASNGLLGAVVGCAIGSVVAWWLPAILQGLEQGLGFTLLPADIYFISQVPSELFWGDILFVFLCAIATAILATLYPAWQAARTSPARALRSR